ncbi:MAG: M1 family metallopeptidase [Flavobacteriales bacterium]
MGRNTLLILFLLPLPFILSPFSLDAQQYKRLREKDHQHIFEPLRAPSPSPFRTESGKPAPDYWQNSADYKLDVELKPSEHLITGKVHITYSNNSPQKLHFLWLQLDQNKFAKGSRGMDVTPPTQTQRFRGDTTQGHRIKSIRVKDGMSDYEAEYLINDTRMKVNLQEALKPGDEIELKIEFSFEVPEYGADRMGRLQTKNGWIYEIAQWYPRMCVFDDIKGWNVEPYLGTGEFYLEYGNFDLKVTVPHDHIVAASGKLQNPSEVLTDEQVKQLEKAKSSDKTVDIISPKEAGSAKKTRQEGDEKLTWHYRIENARDIAWASSPAFIWDAAKADVTKERSVTVMSFYPIESNGDTAWGRSTEYTQASIEHYSEKWHPYPYRTASNIAGIVGGMEYPGLSFCHWRSTNKGLWGVTDHEFGHNWFPMMVGTNERLYAWMDEGMNTFINHYSTKNFNDGEYPTRYSDMDRIIDELRKPEREPVHTYPDVIQGDNLGQSAYGKPALGLIMLREYILGPERFDPAFKAYIDRWAYKHPTPRDFFNTIENVAGEELDWFWREWFYTNKNVDQAITSISYVEGDPEKGALISIAERGGVYLPVTVKVKEKDGDSGRKRMPVEIWQRNEEWTFRYNSDSKIDKALLDPEGLVPDVNPGNDVLKGSGR